MLSRLENLSSLIARLRIELYTLSYLVWLFPIVLFQIILFFRFPSWIGLILVFSVLITGYLFTSVVVVVDKLTRQISVISGYLIVHGDCKYLRYTLKDYLDENILSETLNLESSITKFYRNRTIDSRIHIFAVKKGKKGSSFTCPTGLVTYSIPFDDSYIFVRDEPEKTTGIAKFFIYHEVGHTLITTERYKVRLVIGTKTLYFFLFWSIWNVGWTGQSILIVLSLLMTIITMNREWNRRRKTLRLEDEVWADNFALAVLLMEDIRAVAKFFLLNPFFEDASMDKQQNSSRAEIFQQNLALTVERMTKSSNSLLEASTSNSIFHRVLTLSDASFLYPPLEIITVVIIIVTLSTFGSEPSISFLIGNWLFWNFPIFLVLIVVSLVNIYLQFEIERFLDAHSS